MKKYESVLFDLDGTLTDSGPGITKSVAQAFTRMGMEPPCRKELNLFVGPPLASSFARYGMNPEQVDEAIRLFRERYTTVGKFENFPYDGVSQLLERLQADGYRLFIATSKPENIAIEVLQHFQLDGYFEKICVASLDHPRETKEAVLEYLKQQCHIGNAVMIGDTEFDVKGAKEHGIPCSGVTWGYGNRKSMEDAGAIAIASTMDELYDLIVQQADAALC